jgi:TolB protein
MATDVSPDPRPASPPPSESGPRRPSAPLLGALAAIVAAVALVGASIWIVTSSGGGSASPSAASSSGPSSVAVAPSTPVDPGTSGSGQVPSAVPSSAPVSSAVPGEPIASSGSIAVVGTDGSLWLVDAAGNPTALLPADAILTGFPAWSPDGTHLAAVRIAPTGNEILVFDAAGAAAGRSAKPVTILHSTTIGPFYLAWTPDGREISFLADESTGLSLRIAPADGSAPLDGSGAGATIRSGNPFYFDWLEPARLIAHIGTGPSAFLGELGRDGASASHAVTSPGDFRAPIVNRDGTLVSYVRTETSGAEAVVVAGRDGSGERSMPVFGTAAVAFDPAGTIVASIGPTEPDMTAYTIPIGPLRALDAKTGKVRTLLDGTLVGFWWSPDGKTIAGLRVQPVAGAAAPSASPGSSPAPPETEIRLLFVDVATGKVQSEAVVNPGQLFIDQVLTYFDQYALSHRLWAPDSSSILLPVIDEAGTTRIAVMPRAGGPPRMIDGALGFWSP